MDEYSKMVIMDHYKYPHYKITPDSNLTKYEQIEGYNPSCGDKLTLYIIKKDNKLKILWDGNGCSICCASCSIMCDECNNLNIEEIINKINNFHNLLLGKDYDQKLFNEANMLSGLQKFPSRFKCGYLAWETLLMAINND